MVQSTNSYWAISLILIGLSITQYIALYILGWGIQWVSTEIGMPEVPWIGTLVDWYILIQAIINISAWTRTLKFKPCSKQYLTLLVLVGEICIKKTHLKCQLVTFQHSILPNKLNQIDYKNRHQEGYYNIE